jgi:hypothetical protein
MNTTVKQPKNMTQIEKTELINKLQAKFKEETKAIAETLETASLDYLIDAKQICQEALKESKKKRPWLVRMDIWNLILRITNRINKLEGYCHKISYLI